MDCLRNLHESLITERGIPPLGVSIWRKPRDGRNTFHTCTVGEFLSCPENQYGTWYIDGGWGGPPGPIVVRWDAASKSWDNGGYCGWRFKPGPEPKQSNPPPPLAP